MSTECPQSDKCLPLLGEHGARLTNLEKSDSKIDARFDKIDNRMWKLLLLGIGGIISPFIASSDEAVRVLAYISNLLS